MTELDRPQQPSQADERAGGLPELRFVRPMAGFPGLNRFVLVDLAPEGRADSAPPVLYELRSLEDPHVRFLVAVPTAFFPDYVVELDDAATDEIGLQDAADALVLVVLTTEADAGTATANLLAPVVLDARTRTAAQVILPGDWPVRAPLG